MANRLESPQHDRANQVLYWISFFAALLGSLDSIYLYIYKLTGNKAMCIGNGGCHDVNFSPYSMIYGIPVALFGLAAYIAILAIHLLEPRLILLKDNGPLAVFGIGLAGVAFTVYLTYLELYVIHAICPFCVASAVLITIIFIVAIIRLVRQTVP
jgi:uncharacterized membrane protein